MEKKKKSKNGFEQEFLRTLNKHTARKQVKVSHNIEAGNLHCEYQKAWTMQKGLQSGKSHHLNTKINPNGNIKY